MNDRFAPTAAVRKSEWIAMSAFHLEADIAHPRSHVSFVPILLQKSQKAKRLIFRQRTKQATIADQ